MYDFPENISECSERGYCRACVAALLIYEVEDYIRRIEYGDAELCSPESLLKTAPCDPVRSYAILTGYRTTFHNIVDEVWSPLH